MKVTILRGIPGSGKTTYARTLDAAKTISADDFFMVGGTYMYNPRTLATAHATCMHLYLEAVAKKSWHIVVDNTNTTPWEVAAYYQIATAYCDEVKVVRLYCDPVVAFKRNVHGVPLGKVLSMHQRLLEPLPPWVVEEIILSEDVK